MGQRIFKLTKASCPYPVDPAVRALSTLRLQEDVAGFVDLLDGPSDEGALHAHLINRSYFFNGLIRLFNPFPVYSKVKLGHQYEVDFVCVEVGSLGVEWRFVEIESPAKSCFTKRDELSADFHKAVEQVRAWSHWFRENNAFAQKLFPHLDNPSFVLFVGKRRDLNERRRAVMRRFQFDNRHWLTVHTLDRFASMARGCADLLGAEGGNWLAPLRAYSHSEFVERLPSQAFDWLTGNQFLQDATSHFRSERLSEREARTRLDGDFE